MVMAVSAYLLIFLAYAVWAFSALFVKKAVASQPPLLVTALAALFGAVALAPFLLAYRKEIASLPRASWLWIVAAGILWIAVGEVLHTWGLKGAELSRAGLLGLAFPVIATALSVAFLDEELGLRFLVGSAVMAAGFLIVVL